MKEKLKIKGMRKSLFKASSALKFTAIFLGIVLITQVMSSANLFAQENAKHKVTGKIISATDNNSLPGVSILVKGTTNGTVTGVDGRFAIDVSDNDVLVVSFLGYVTKEVSVAGKSQVDISLNEDVKKLDEVVVVGYGVQKKKLVTGATVSMKGKIFKNSILPMHYKHCKDTSQG